jgi:hypothetical protein
MNLFDYFFATYSIISNIITLKHNQGPENISMGTWLNLGLVTPFTFDLQLFTQKHLFSINSIAIDQKHSFTNFLKNTLVLVFIFLRWATLIIFLGRVKVKRKAGIGFVVFFWQIRKFN